MTLQPLQDGGDSLSVVSILQTMTRFYNITASTGWWQIVIYCFYPADNDLVHMTLQPLQDGGDLLSIVSILQSMTRFHDTTASTGWWRLVIYCFHPAVND
ncbi:hypothetical protein RRG08_025548 [Elysia crispata]|uniref:Uncharacterized protein n=1 Tax=Elysia crispata TaxID=231223 RepID=A0AAE1B8I0_9GAST|nr:hypothetical protein RRG08_025548 [Elysia crispata]